MKKIFSLLLLFSFCVLHAQMSNTTYFDKYNLRQHKMNPAMQPIGEFYIGMPALSTIAVSGGNSRFVFQDLFQNEVVDGEKRTLLFLDKNADASMYDNFVDQLKAKERLFASYRMDIIDFGFRNRHNGYVTVGLSNRMETMVILPHQTLGLAFGQMHNGESYDMRVNRLSASASLYTELALGYSMALNDQFTVGAKLKYLYGHANVYTDFYDASLVGNEDEWYLKGDACIRASVPGLRFVPDEEMEIDEVEFDDDQSVSSYAKPQGHGASIDLGATYQCTNLPLQLSASVLDLGFIRWTKNISQLDYNQDFVYDGIDYRITDTDDLEDYYDSYEEQLHDMYKINSSPSAYTSALATKFLLGAEYAFWNDRVGVGALSKTYIFRRTAWEEFLISCNFRPSVWYSLSLTYGLFDGEWNNLSAGMNFNLGAFNLNFAVDNIPFKYAKSNDVIYPSNRRSVRAQVGIAFLFKYKDTDKPIEAKVMPDTDNDGVPDEFDLCPNTLANVSVDSTGCPVDSDGDGVPDYLDQCPNTSLLASVDSLGCPLDGDGDGVADYMDQCPNTVAEARGTVDAYGCPMDSDGDGVLDYLDRCPNTPAEAIGKVDSLGCPLDSDGDGIADYLDKCPLEPGIAENSGCPEVKAEVKQLFKKALNGIQFESGKSVIKKSSNAILNEIVKTMQENPAYILSISGHTDNTGMADKNQALSEERANAVASYLIKNGVDAERIKSTGYGDTKPVADNKTPAGRAKNRRVELEVEFEK